ncbi:MAG TPA: cystathionine gamma-synthase [candidate division Zixibacteria bacterium]|nr:cystathionine gamma-synthase [candidate division Zixibacteria bacterium]
MSTPKRSTDHHHFETLSVHAGIEPDPVTGSVMTPIYQTSTYAQDDVGQHKGYEYSRTDNPTRTVLQKAMAILEGGKFALAFSSGMAAIDTLFRLFEPGTHVVSGDDVYGGTFRLFDEVLAAYGITFSYVDTTDIVQIRDAIKENTRLIWLETPTNPMLRLTDLEQAAEVARQTGIVLAVDNTFASPALQRPLSLGADIVVHSTTKYIGGHSDVVGGVIVLDNPDLYDRLKFLQNAIGAIPGPQDCFLTLRGIKTLALRMQAHCRNASQIAHFLEGHPSVEQVVYPGLESHPQFELAGRQMDGPGGIVSLNLVNGESAARTLVQETRLFTLAESLGGVESLIELPHPMTHASITHSRFAIDPGLIRLSVGIENAQDLIDDLARALAKT